MTQVRDRIAVVTGAGRGLGRGVAVALAAARPSGGRRRPQRRPAGRDGGHRRRRGRPDGQPPDRCGRPGRGRGAGRFVAEQFGPPSILVNAAGMFGPIAMIRDSDPRAWVQTVMIDADRAVPDRARVRRRDDRCRLGAHRQHHLGGVAPSARRRSTAPMPRPRWRSTSSPGTWPPEIAGTGVTANVIHPGDVKTDMWQDIRDRVAVHGPRGRALPAMGGVGRGDRRRPAREGGRARPGADLGCRAPTATASSAGSRTRCRRPIHSWDKPTDARPWISDE